MERKKKTVEPLKKQATLFHFAGFQKKDSNENAEVKFKEKYLNKFPCRFCGSDFKQAGARKTHEYWCKENPNGMGNPCASKNRNFEDLNSENLTEILQDKKESDAMASKDQLLPIIDEILDKACESGAPGGWNLAEIFTKKSKKR